MANNDTTQNGDGPQPPQEEMDKYYDPKVRRQIRAEYRDLAADIEGSAEDTNPQSTKLSEYLDKAETLFSKIRHPREAVHDSAVMITLAKKGREQAQQLKTDLVSFDNHTFMEKLITYVGGRNIADANKQQDDGVCDLSNTAWKQLGNRCRPLFRKTPAFDFLLGPLVLEVVIKPKKERNLNRAKLPQGDAVKLKSIASVDQQEEATTKEVERVYKVLRKATNAGQEAICLFTFFINPSSFGQSVENLFHLSFLIKDGRASVELDEDGLPVVNLHKEYNEKEHEEIIHRKQVVMPFTMSQWQDVIQTYEITVPLIPTRDTILVT